MMNYDEQRQKDRKTERQNDKKTERKIEGMTKRQNGRKTENPCREALLVKMNHIINGDLIMNGKDES